MYERVQVDQVDALVRDELAHDDQVVAVVELVDQVEVLGHVWPPMRNLAGALLLGQVRAAVPALYRLEPDWLSTIGANLLRSRPVFFFDLSLWRTTLNGHCLRWWGCFLPEIGATV